MGLHNRLGFIWLAGMRDLRWRRRRFVIAVFATSLVFAITLLLAGFSESFGVDARRVVRRIGADGYVVPDATRGPFMSPHPFSTDEIASIARTRGLRSAAPLISTIQPDFYLIAFAFDGAPVHEGEAVVDARLNIARGSHVRVGAKELVVTQVTHGDTVLGGQPIVVVNPADAYDALFAGHPFVTSVAVTGRPLEPLPTGFIYVTRAQAVRDLLRPLHVVQDTIRLITYMLWIVAAAIVGSVIYVSTLERVRDLSVFKAIGADTSDLLAALVLQAVLTSLGASFVAIALGHALAPLFPAAVSFPATLVAALPAVALVVGLVASGAGLRRAVRVDPAVAMESAG